MPTGKEWKPTNKSSRMNREIFSSAWTWCCSGWTQHQKKDTMAGQHTFFDILHNEGSAHRTKPELNHTCHAFSSPFSSSRSPQRKDILPALHPPYPSTREGWSTMGVYYAIVRTTGRQTRESSGRSHSSRRSAAGLAILQTPSNKFSLNKDQLKKVNQHQVATTPSLRRQPQRLTSDWFHHRPRHGLDLVWRSMPAAGLLGLRTFLSHVKCNDSVRREVFGAVPGLHCTWHDSTPALQQVPLLHPSRHDHAVKLQGQR